MFQAYYEYFFPQRILDGIRFNSFYQIFQSCYDYFFPTQPRQPFNGFLVNSFNDDNVVVISIGRDISGIWAPIFPIRYQGLDTVRKLYMNHPAGRDYLTSCTIFEQKRPQIILNTKLEDIPECLGIFSSPVFTRISLDADLLATLDTESILELFKNIQQESQNYTRETPLIIDVNLDEFYKKHPFGDVLQLSNKVQEFNSKNVKFNVVQNMIKRSAYIAGGKNHLLFTRSDAQKNITQPRVTKYVEKHIFSFLK